MIGSCASTCWACCAPNSTSCCCETPHPDTADADAIATTAATPPHPNRLIRVPCRERNPPPRRQDIFPSMKLLTLARDLQRRKSRERQGLFVAEGIRAVEELLTSDLAIRGAI